MKIKNRFDRVLKMLTVFAMTMSCFVAVSYTHLPKPKRWKAKATGSVV